MINKNIVYTPEAEKRLEKAKIEFIEKLEDSVESNKYYPGDEVLEITASDIEMATRYYSLRQPTSTSFKLNVLIMYVIMGIFMSFFGLFYDQFMSLIKDNPIRLVLVLGGMMMSIAGLLLYVKIKSREATRDLFISKKDMEKNS